MVPCCTINSHELYKHHTIHHFLLFMVLCGVVPLGTLLLTLGFLDSNTPGENFSLLNLRFIDSNKPGKKLLPAELEIHGFKKAREKISPC